jgi:hypothetical protein
MGRGEYFKHLEFFLQPYASSHHKIGLRICLFSSPQKQKKIQYSPSHQLLRHIHGALNVDKNKN